MAVAASASIGIMRTGGLLKVCGLVVAVCLPLCGCSGGLGGSTALIGGGSPEGDAAPSTALNLPKLADLPEVSSIVTPAEPEPEGSATELYTRIARGAMSCWFGGPTPPLKKDYIYHAEADAPSRGGKAEIVVHMRDPSQPNPRGAKAYKIKIDPKDETSATVVSENLKMPEPVATAMSADVARWSRGDPSCTGISNLTGWAEQETAATDAGAASKTFKAQSRKRPKLRQSQRASRPASRLQKHNPDQIRLIGFTSTHASTPARAHECAT